MCKTKSKTKSDRSVKKSDNSVKKSDRSAKKVVRSKRPSAPRTKVVEIAKVYNTSNALMGTISMDKKTGNYTFVSVTKYKITDTDVSKIENDMYKNGIRYMTIKFSPFYDRITKSLC